MTFKQGHTKAQRKAARARGVAASNGNRPEPADRRQTKACTLCVRLFHPREGERQWEFDKRKRCQEPDCREHAIETGALVLRQYARSKYDRKPQPPIPNPAQWGFPA